jgi:hypothetical protein
MAMDNIFGATDVSMQPDTDTRSETMRQTGRHDHGEGEEAEGTGAHEVEMETGQQEHGERDEETSAHEVEMVRQYFFRRWQH